MDNIPQTYTDDEDAIMTSALGLFTGLAMKGDVLFKNFRTTFDETKYLKSFYNKKEGGVYGKMYYTIRGNHSRVAARITNYHYHCKNPAYGVSKETLLENEVYLEEPNSHSAIYC
ncbi:hypothetical protein TL16_g02607 [Triparma laevis f. inornata]|uniref:Uncharacterized protein n=1 Tax=Triparma laevis f. inornata TaxID=1714386 RepID=A0A9W7DW07_9STRA|nr:hypothetical protein TL16_g02607 [Triparma laevis f. inornata]